MFETKKQAPIKELIKKSLPIEVWETICSQILSTGSPLYHWWDEVQNHLLERYDSRRMLEFAAQIEKHCDRSYTTPTENLIKHLTAEFNNGKNIEEFENLVHTSNVAFSARNRCYEYTILAAPNLSFKRRVKYSNHLLEHANTEEELDTASKVIVDRLLSDNKNIKRQDKISKNNLLYALRTLKKNKYIIYHFCHNYYGNSVFNDILPKLTYEETYEYGKEFSDPNLWIEILYIFRSQLTNEQAEDVINKIVCLDSSCIQNIGGLLHTMREKEFLLSTKSTIASVKKLLKSGTPSYNMLFCLLEHISWTELTATEIRTLRDDISHILFDIYLIQTNRIPDETITHAKELYDRYTNDDSITAKNLLINAIEEGIQWQDITDRFYLMELLKFFNQDTLWEHVVKSQHPSLTREEYMFIFGVLPRDNTSRLYDIMKHKTLTHDDRVKMCRIAFSYDPSCQIGRWIRDYNQWTDVYKNKPEYDIIRISTLSQERILEIAQEINVERFWEWVFMSLLPSKIKEYASDIKKEALKNLPKDFLEKCLSTEFNICAAWRRKIAFFLEEEKHIFSNREIDILVQCNPIATWDINPFFSILKGRLNDEQFDTMLSRTKDMESTLTPYYKKSVMTSYENFMVENIDHKFERLRKVIEVFSASSTWETINRYFEEHKSSYQLIEQYLNIEEVKILPIREKIDPYLLLIEDPLYSMDKKISLILTLCASNDYPSWKLKKLPWNTMMPEHLSLIINQLGIEGMNLIVTHLPAQQS